MGRQRRSHDPRGSEQGHPHHGQGPREQHSLWSDPRRAGAHVLAQLPKCSICRTGDSVLDAHRLPDNPAHGYHSQHGRSLLTDPGRRHAGGQRDRGHREHLPPHAGRGQPYQCCVKGNARGRLCHLLFHPDHSGRVLAALPLAGCDRGLHVVPALYSPPPC